MSLDQEFASFLKRIAAAEPLDADESARAFGAIMSGQVSEARIAAFLTALAVREATVDEIIGAARAMRAAMRTIKAPEGAIDLCGTGGDGHATLNVSTAASFVVAACGVPVAKHGNRNMSSRSGAADVLEALGVRIDLAPEAAEECLADVGLCFLFAPTYHPAMKHVANVRKQLGFRTIFNLLGPICNPANVKRQLIGVFAKNWAEPFARVLQELRTEKAWVVHGADGLDEMTTTDTTDIVLLAGQEISSLHVRPEEFQLPRASLADIRGGTPRENADAIRELLNGAAGPFRDITLLNSAAALVVADKTPGLGAGLTTAANAIDSGAANSVFKRLATATKKLAA
jgi:anthranilate phosphoribosyltransferase